MLPGHRQRQRQPRLARAPYLPLRLAVTMRQIAQLPLRSISKSVTLHLAESPRHALAHIRATVEGHHAPTPRHQIHQALERYLYGFEIAIDIGMVKLHMGQDRRVGEVVHELRTLVEECRIVLVTFENETLARRKLKAGAKVLGHSADQKRRPVLAAHPRRRLVNPGQHARRCGFSMRSRHDQ
jgi:hypothetical protein